MMFTNLIFIFCNILLPIFRLYLSMISVTLFLHYSIDISSLSHTYPTSYMIWDIGGISMGYLWDI